MWTKRRMPAVTAAGVVLTAILLFCSCGQNQTEEESPVSSQTSSSSAAGQVFTCIGTWEITAARQNDIALNVEDVLEEIGGNIVLTLYKDGSMYGRILNASMDGTWAQEGTQITVYMSNGESITLTSQEQTLIMEQGDRKLIFSKTEE